MSTITVVCALSVLACLVLPAAASATEEAPAATKPAPTRDAAATAQAPAADKADKPTSIEDEPLDKKIFAPDPDSGEKGSAPKREKSDDGAIGRMLFGLVFVLALIWGVHWLLKRYGQSRSGAGNFGASGVIDVLATTPLAADRALHLVRVGDEVVLVGATSQSITHLRTLANSSSTDATAAAMGGKEFQSRLYGAIAAQGGTAAPSAMGTTSLPPSVLAAMSGGTAPQIQQTDDSFLRRFFANLQHMTAR